MAGIKRTRPDFTPRWLRLIDAALYSAIGEKRLVNLAEAGEIKGFRDPDNGRHDWIFDRESIDAYREGQAAGSSASKIDIKFAELLERKRSRQVRKR